MKTKALISSAVTAQLICVFVFAYAKSRFSHNEALITDKTKGIRTYALKQNPNTLTHRQEEIDSLRQVLDLVTLQVKKKVSQELIM